jgi:hypothetical protein
LSPCTPFAELANVLKPGASGRDIAELLDNKVSRHLALHWKAGRSMPPAWAIDLLRGKLARRHEQERAIADKAKPGPGLKAGARNLAAYLAARRA